MPNATLKDIAKKSGLSVSTVSRLLNDKYGAKSAKAKKVLKIAEDLGYTPNYAAVMLRTNSSKIIGVIVPLINNGFFSSILEGIEKELKLFGYRVIICQTNDSTEEERQAILQLERLKVDGILISLSRNSQNIDLLRSLHEDSTKVLQFDRIVSDPVVPSVEMQDEEAASIAMSELLAKGFTSFLYIGLAPDISNDQSRKTGYSKAFDKYTHTIDTYYTDKIIASELQPRVTGIDCILCYNDSIAVEVLLQLKKLDIAVPQQISVVGFDDRPFCGWLSPTLSSVNRPVELLGKHSAQRILKKIDQTIEVEEVSLSQPKLVIRESVR